MVILTPLPFTLRGVGRFATVPVRQLFLTELVVALGLACVFGWFANATWFSQITAAICNLPARGELNRGVFVWHGDSPVQLAGSKFVAFAIDLNHEAELGHEADLCVEFGREEIQLHSLLGYVRLDYPRNWHVTIERAQLEPWWRAWAPAILACTCAVVVLLLFVVWTVLGAVYTWPAALIAFLANRRLDLSGAWRLAGAAQMPGAVMLGLGIVLYGIGWLDLVRFGGCVVLQFLVGWFFVLVAPLTLERLVSPEIFRGNPFAQTRTTTPDAEPGVQHDQNHQ